MNIVIHGKKYTIRWRKTTATWVIYHRGRVFESGFIAEESALAYLTERIERDAAKEAK